MKLFERIKNYFDICNYILFKFILHLILKSIWLKKTKTFDTYLGLNKLVKKRLFKRRKPFLIFFSFYSERNLNSKRHKRILRISKTSKVIEIFSPQIRRLITAPPLQGALLEVTWRPARVLIYYFFSSFDISSYFFCII